MRQYGTDRYVYFYIKQLIYYSLYTDDDMDVKHIYPKNPFIKNILVRIHEMNYTFTRHTVIHYMKSVKAFSPGHITGFFELYDIPKSPLHKGSRGAGFSLAAGVTTTVTIIKSSTHKTEIRLNGTVTKEAVVSQRVIELFFRQTGLDPAFHISVEHLIDIPVGAGCGSSGAGALSLAVALNEAFDTGLSRIEAARIAHQAEVENKTGLGTVIGETFGGIEIRVKPGAPGTGRLLTIPPEIQYTVVALILGPLSTKELLQNRRNRKLIKRFGARLMKRIITEPSVENFLLFSRWFSEKTGLMDPEVKHIISVLGKEGIVAGMPMFGRGVFTLVPVAETERVKHLLFTCTGCKNSIVCNLDFQGVRVIDGS
jgi:pantoate kinase